MAAVSTNYGTAGDSNLESSGSRSRATKDSSGSNSRSRSMSRVRRKRAGTSSQMPRSSSKEQLFREGSMCADSVVIPPKEGKGKEKDVTGGDRSVRASSRDPAARLPMRRSMFPLSAPPKQTTTRSAKGKGTVRGHDDGPANDSDAIELLPQIRQQDPARNNDDTVERKDPDKMVIRKEVGYSVQYEDDEVQLHGEGMSTADAVAHM